MPAFDLPVLLFFAVLLVAAIFSTKLGSRFGVPVLLLFLGLGILVGSDVLNLFYFGDALLTKRIADIILIFVLFDGGFRTTKRSLRLASAPALVLATAGVALTAAALGWFIHIILKYDLPRSMMIASIISSTDAAAVMLITRQNPVRERLAATLNVESAANDPMAILLTIGFVEIVTGTTGSPLSFVLSFVWQFTGGVLVGFCLARLSRFLFNWLKSDNRGYYYVLSIAVILLTYGFADLIKANGIIAVFFMGYWLGNSEFAGKRGVSNFMEGISSFGNIALFLMLGLLAFPRNFSGVWKEGLLIVAAMMFVARPLAILACALPFRYSPREALFLAWGGIKGAVPIALATYPASAGLDPDGSIFNIIFFAVLLSCLLQGTTLGPLARALGLTVPGKPVSPHSIELHSTATSDLDMVEFRVGPGAPCVGRHIAQLGLDEAVVISSIIRDGAIVPPRGNTEIRGGDILFVLLPVKSGERVASIFGAGQEAGA